jgi:hypothetical protein
MRLLVMIGIMAAPLNKDKINAGRLEAMLREERVFEGIAEIKAVVCADSAGCRIYVSKKTDQSSDRLLPPLSAFAKRHDYAFGFRVHAKPGTDGSSETVLSISG